MKQKHYIITVIAGLVILLAYFAYTSISTPDEETLKKDVSARDSEIIDLKNQINNQIDQINLLSREKLITEKKADSLMTLYQSYYSQVDSLKKMLEYKGGLSGSERRELNNIIKSQQEEIERLKTEVAELNLSSQKDKDDAYLSLIEELRKENKELKKLNKFYREENELLKKENKQLRAKVENLEKVVNEYKTLLEEERKNGRKNKEYISELENTIKLKNDSINIFLILTDFVEI